DNQRFLLIAATVVLVAAVAVGMVARGGAPPAAAIPTTAPAAAPTEAAGVGVAPGATAGVEGTAQGDDRPAETGSLGRSESVSFMASNRLVISVSDGGAVRVVVNGRDLGIPGTRGTPWSRSFVAPGSQPPASP